MSYPVTCPECGGSFRVDAETLGKRIRCNYCRSGFVAVEDALRPDRPHPRRDDRLRSEPAPRRAPARVTADDEERPLARRSVAAPANRTVLWVAGAAVVGLLLLIAGVVVGMSGMLRSTDPVAFVANPAPAAKPDPAPAEKKDAAPPPAQPVTVAKPVTPPAEDRPPPPADDPPPPPIAAAPAPAPPADGGFLAGGEPLRYRWRGAPLVYRVRVEGERDNVSDIIEGNCIINVRPLAAPDAPAEPTKGTGTAFVVHPDGFLVTCAHVVRDASKVEVTVAGRTYQAAVRAVDTDHDLAVLKVDAKGLAVLPLGNSDACQVGQDVWALGFPLATVLGNDLKVTRGTLSGVTRPAAGRKVFLIDAPINPGNSGGPLVGEDGAVIGVNRAKLAGEAVSNVGIATPGGEVKRLLQSKTVGFTAVAAGPRLAGPALVERASPAVARVTVTVDRSPAERFELTWRTALTSREKLKPGVLPLGGALPSSMAGTPGRIAVDSSGGTSGGSGGRQLPYLLGEVAQLLLEPLPPDGRTSWEVSGTCAITQNVARPFGAPPIPFGPRFGPRMRPPFGGPIGSPFADPEPETRQASERSVYTRSAPRGDTVTIHKRYELKLNPSANLPGVSLIGEGTVLFDVKDGLPQAVDFKGTYTQTRDGTSTRIPVTVAYRLTTGAQREAVLNPAPPPPPAPADVDQLLAAVKGADGPARNVALSRLAGMTLMPARRAEVAREVQAALTTSAAAGKAECLRALAVWGDRDCVPAILPLLEDSSSLVRVEAINTLGKLDDERAIDPIAKRLTDPPTRHVAGQALRRFGAKAERAVLPHLDNADLFVRMEVCNILKEIGTEQSRPALQKTAAGDANRVVQSVAAAALRAITARR
ncbi:MAG: trypsin-like peptidase domain-containing protein [Gemmataceae bacterium]